MICITIFVSHGIIFLSTYMCSHFKVDMNVYFKVQTHRSDSAVYYFTQLINAQLVKILQVKVKLMS